MKKITYILAALLASAVLVGCGGGDDAADTTAQTTAVEPAAARITLDAAYTIIRDEDGGSSATAAGIALHEALGNAPTIKTDWVKRDATPVFGELEILLGTTDRPESAELGAGLGLYDYKIAMMGKKLVIAGGCEDALVGAVAHLIESGALAGGAIDADYSYFYDGADSREEYIADPSRFIPSWLLNFDVPDWLTDYTEKQAAWADHDGRMMTAIHRADHFNYPENSIEAILSCIHAGADSLELDVGLTKDGVPVLLHDDTLRRTTDWSVKAGKDGLPSSDKLVDWTLADLRRLRLKTNAGAQTDYLIPTMEEVLEVCRGRIWVRLDKLNAFDWARDIAPLIEKTEAWDTLIFNRQYTISAHRTYAADVRAKGGVPLNYQTLTNGNDWPAMLKALDSLEIDPLLWWTGYNKKEHKSTLTAAKAALDGIRGQARIYVDAQSLGGADETPQVWDELYAAGVNFILVDDMIGVQKYVAEHYSATK